MEIFKFFFIFEYHQLILLAEMYISQNNSLKYLQLGPDKTNELLTLT